MYSLWLDIGNLVSLIVMGLDGKQTYQDFSLYSSQKSYFELHMRILMEMQEILGGLILYY